MMKFNDGDIVCLKSGGAKMTVQTGVLADDQELVAVVWCDAADVPHREYFHPAMLMKIPVEPIGAPFTIRKGEKISGLQMLQNPQKARFYRDNKEHFLPPPFNEDAVIYNGPDAVVQY
jgi:uncharacterized protein YodC (DUF2158 family)